MPKQKKKGKVKPRPLFVNDLIDLSNEEVADRRFSDFQPLTTATRLEQEAVGTEMETDKTEAVFEGEALRLRSVTPPSNYASSQTVFPEPSEFVTLDARLKQTAEQNSSHAERETIHYSPRSSKLTLDELAMKAFRDRIKLYEQQLSQAKMAISMLEQDKGDNLNFSKSAILPSSPEPKTLPLVDSVSGQLRQRALHTSHESLPDQVTYKPATQTFLVSAKLPEAKGAAPSAGKSNLLQEAEMPQVFPQAQTQTPPGGVGVLLDGTQARFMQQRQMTASPAGHANIADQAQMATGIQQIPVHQPQQLQMPAYVPQPQVQIGPPPGPPPMAQPRPFLGPQQAQQIPQAFLPAQPAYQMQAPYQAFSVSPLTGESKLKMSGHNYKAWVSEITLLLLREGSHCMVFNPPAQPWTYAIRDLEIRARTTLLMSMDTELQVTFPPNTTARQIWAELENCYRPISIESSCLLMSELHGSRLKPGEQIGGHLTKLKGLRTELRERGHNIEDIQMISIIINSLNYEWKDAVTKINQVPIAQRTVDNVCRLLIEEEAFMLATPHLRGPPASRAPARRPFRGRTYAPRMPRCYTCNRVGHATRDCPQRVPAPVTYQPRGTDSRGRGRGGRQGRRGPRRDPQTPLATLALTNDPQPQPEYDRRLLWTLDSGAALHVTYRKELFTEMHEPEPELRELYSFSNHPCQVKGKGTVYVEELDAFIPDVYYIPTATSNLLSQCHLSRMLKFQVHHLEKASYIVKDGDIVAETILIGGVYYLKPKPKTQTQASMQTPKRERTGPERDAPERDPVATPKAPKANKNRIGKQVAQSKPEVPHKTVNVENSLTGKPLHSRCIHKWHRRLGHASFRVLRKMPEFAKGLDLKGCKVFLDCAVCKKAKSKAAAIPKRATRLSTRIFDLVHIDIVGPFPPSFGGRKYFLTIVDNYSRYGYVYPMKEKSETFQIFKDFATLVSTQHQVRIARIQSDRGAEFMSQRFQDWMRKNRIIHQTSPPDTPAHNGEVLQTMMHCLLEDANLDMIYWGEAIKYANYIVNRTWSSVTNQTPFFMLYGYKPDLKNIHIFGSYAMVNIPLAQRRKGSPAAKRLRFMGIDDNSKWSKFIDSKHVIVISQSANFEEDIDWSRIHSNDPGVYFPRDDTADATQIDDQDSTDSSQPDVPSSQAADADASDESEDEDEAEEDWTVVPRRSKRVTKGIPPQRYSWQLTKAPLPLICNVTLPPDNFTQIKQLPDSEQDKWYEAMQVEMDSLKKLKVFTPAKPPANKKVIGTRWVYRIKKKPNGESLYKARLVAQGFAQRYPEDYTNTYSPTVRTESVKIALATATILGLEVFQFDVDTAYLHADLDEEIYVRSPPGFRQQEGDTWFLNKSLYGLKQSGLMWYLCLTDKLNSMGFIKSETDECVFTKRSNNAYEIVLVYVDDIVYIGPNKQMSEIFAKALQRYFTLKSLGHISTYLGVQIEKTQKGFSLSQEDKIEQVLHHCNMKDANTTKTPMQTDFHNLTQEESPEFEDQTLYRSVIGSLLYISSWTRPDIALSVNLLSRHVGKAKQFHWTCIKKLLRYLKYTKHLKLLLEPTHTDYAELCCYADSDWASDKKSRKSTSGYMMFLNGCPVYWQVRKQNFVSCSSTEAEYACVSDACNSLTWFDALVTDIWTHPIRPITVMEDNESVVYISESHFTGSRSRHIDIRYQNIKHLVKKGFVKMQYVSTHDQIADMLNKPLPAAQHEYLRKKMCLI